MMPFEEEELCEKCFSKTKTLRDDYFFMRHCVECEWWRAIPPFEGPDDYEKEKVK
jgi:hypothetical protein